MPDQKTDDENRAGKGPNMTLSTTSKSPTTTGSPTWKDHGDQSQDDNNAFHGRVTAVKRNAG